MKLRFICCDVFLRLACDIVSKSPHIVDVEFVPMLAHNEPDKLRKELQKRIDEGVKIRRYDALILGYGLCGNTSAGLTCEIPMFLPRVHDCCAIFMGSREKFLNEFEDSLSMRWCTNGYYERSHLDGNSGDDYEITYATNPEYLKLVEQYGEENAEYVWETMHPKIETHEAAYIEIKGFEYGDSMDGYKKRIEESGTELRILSGDVKYLTQLVNGPWDTKKFLRVEPGKKVTPVYDMETVFNAEG